MTQWVTDTKKIGLGLTTFGIVFLVLGVLLFFDRPLLTLGNLLFVTGTIVLIGPSCLKYFSDPSKFRGTLCFLLGVLLVLFKYPIIGMCLEIFGIANLFGNFFPVILAFFRKLPFIGPILNHPWLKPFLNKLAGESSMIIGEDY